MDLILCFGESVVTGVFGDVLEGNVAFVPLQC